MAWSWHILILLPQHNFVWMPVLLVLGPFSRKPRVATLNLLAYASRTLTSVESRYSQTEREALAVVWGCEKFHLYLYETTFDIFTDHKPLEIIYSPTSKPPARIERWGLRLQPYKFRIQYSPGIDNPADVLSRLLLANQAPHARNAAEENVQYIAQNAAPKAISLSEIQEATKEDPDLQTLGTCIATNNWPKPTRLARISGSKHNSLFSIILSFVDPEL